MACARGEFIDDPSLTPDQECHAIAAALERKKGVFMPHHGSVQVGESLEFTTVETMVFNLCCEYQLAAMAAGGDPMDPKAARSYRAAYYRYRFREQMWLANFRRLRSSDPDLFESAS